MTDSARQAASDLSRAVRVRVIAWLVLVITGGTSGTMSVYHAFRYGHIPWELAILAGAVPVIVAMGMSEIVALYDAGWFLKGLTFLVMAGGLVMTMHASAVVVGPAQGAGFRWGWGLDLDVAALIALFVLLNPRPRRAAARTAATPRKPAAERAAALAVRAVEAYEPSVPAAVAHGPTAPPVAPAATGAMGHGPAGATPGATPDDGPQIAMAADSAESAGSFAERAKEHEDGRERYRQSVLSGSPLSDRNLGKEFGRSRNWGGKRIEEVEAETELAKASSS
jgi:hypothetical protein